MSNISSFVAQSKRKTITRRSSPVRNPIFPFLSSVYNTIVIARRSKSHGMSFVSRSTCVVARRSHIVGNLLNSTTTVVVSLRCVVILQRCSRLKNKTVIANRPKSAKPSLYSRRRKAIKHYVPVFADCRNVIISSVSSSKMTKTVLSLSNIRISADQRNTALRKHS